MEHNFNVSHSARGGFRYPKWVAHTCLKFCNVLLVITDVSNAQQTGPLINDPYLSIENAPQPSLLAYMFHCNTNSDAMYPITWIPNAA